MALQIATDNCYVNEMIHRPGETFEYDGPPSHAFHPVDGEPLPPLNFDKVFGKQVDGVAGTAIDVHQKEIARLTAAVKIKDELIEAQTRQIDKLIAEIKDLRSKAK